MKNRFAALPFALMLSMAAPLTAQEAEKPADEGLTMGEEVKAPPQPYFREESGDWKLECLKTGTAVEPCQLFQEAYDAEGKPLANIRLFRLPDGAQAEAGAVMKPPQSPPARTGEAARCGNLRTSSARPSGQSGGETGSAWDDTAHVAPTAVPRGVRALFHMNIMQLIVLIARPWIGTGLYLCSTV